PALTLDACTSPWEAPAVPVLLGRQMTLSDVAEVEQGIEQVIALRREVRVAANAITQRRVSCLQGLTSMRYDGEFCCSLCPRTPTDRFRSLWAGCSCFRGGAVNCCLVILRGLSEVGGAVR